MLRTLALRIIGTGMVCVSIAACGDNQDDAGARELLTRVRNEHYRDWDRAPGYATRRPSTGPHSNEVDIFVNAEVAQALAVGDHLAAWPVGSTIVKDGWDGSDLQIIAILDKRSDGWYWAEFSGDGDPSYSGHPDTCISCHARGSDSVRAFSLP